MNAVEAIVIARILTRGQRFTIQGLDQQFAVLGCSEPTARRLAEKKTTRPALTVMRAGETGPEFALSDAGVAVKAALSALSDAGVPVDATLS